MTWEICMSQMGKVKTDQVWKEEGEDFKWANTDRKDLQKEMLRKS